MKDELLTGLIDQVRKLTQAVESLSGPGYALNDLSAADCFVWVPESRFLQPVATPNRIDIGLIRGVDRVRDILFDNTRRFAEGFPANNVLLWGARGMGKSSLVKSTHAALQELIPKTGPALKLVEIHREDIESLPVLMALLRDMEDRFILFCDDLSFDVGESSYKALKSVLEGSLELPPENVRVYATSNRRHLMPEFMSDNLKSTMQDGELHPAEAIEEQVSLADRFGLQLSFYPFSQDVYLQAVDALFPEVPDREALHRHAIRFATGKGNAGKPAVMRAVRERGFEPADDNEADALALLLWAIETRGGAR